MFVLVQTGWQKLDYWGTDFLCSLLASFPGPKRRRRKGLVSAELRATDTYDYWIRAETQETDANITHPTGPAPYRMKLDHVAEAILHYKTPGASQPTSADYVSIKEKSIPAKPPQEFTWASISTLSSALSARDLHR